MRHHLAQVNVAQLNHPLEDERTAEFVAALDSINALAESSPGFVWRLTDAEGQSSLYVSISDDPMLIVNFSVWETPDDLQAFVYRTDHRDYLRRRREWFAVMDEVFSACWWIPAAHTPTVDEAMQRLDLLRADGPSKKVFGFRPPFPPPPADDGADAAE